MWTTGLPAEFGHSSGGILSAVYKSGTNAFHGSAEDRYLNGKLVHRQYFDQLKRCDAGMPCNPWCYHEMSATAGGPVYIPKIYNGKDKTFWFFGFQRHHEKVSETAITNVPLPRCTPAISAWAARDFPIYDPDHHAPGRHRQVDPRSVPRQSDPGLAFDPVAKKILSYNPWPMPNRAGRRSLRAGPRRTWCCPPRAVLLQSLRQQGGPPVQREPPHLRPLLAHAEPRPGPVFDRCRLVTGRSGDGAAERFHQHRCLGHLHLFAHCHQRDPASATTAGTRPRIRKATARDGPSSWEYPTSDAATFPTNQHRLQRFRPGGDVPERRRRFHDPGEPDEGSRPAHDEVRL